MFNINNEDKFYVSDSNNSSINAIHEFIIKNSTFLPNEIPKEVGVLKSFDITINEGRVTNDNKLKYDFTIEEYQDVQNEIRHSLKEYLRKSSKFSLKKIKNDVFKSIKQKDIINNPKIDNLFKAIIYQENIIQLGEEVFEIYILKESLIKELNIIEVAKSKAKGNVKISAELLNKIIATKSFTKPDGTIGYMSEEQKASVYTSANRDETLSIVEGVAGAGKSSTMSVIKEAYEIMGFSAFGIALSWNAAGVLANETKMETRAMDSFLSVAEKNVLNGEDPFNKPTLIIVDEAGLIGTNQMDRFLKVVKASSQTIKIILSGDSTQLSPIGTSNALELLGRTVNKNCIGTIKTIRRQDSIPHVEAVMRLRDGYSGQALYIYQQQEMFKWCEDSKDVIDSVLTDYFSDLIEYPNQTSLILSLSNNEVSAINQEIQETLKKLKRISGSGYQISSTDCSSRDPETINLYVGDKISFRKNDKKRDFEVKNGKGEVVDFMIANRTPGVIEKIVSLADGSYDLHVRLTGDNSDLTTIVNTKKYIYEDNFSVPIVLNYAMSIYSSQGQTVDKVYLIDGKQMHRRYSYVACSRHRREMKIYFNKSELFNRYMLSSQKKNYKEEDIAKEKAKFKLSDYLQIVSKSWGRRESSPSAIFEFLDLYEKLNSSNRKFKSNEDKYDFLMKKRLEENNIEIKKTEIKPFDAVEDNLDTPSFFRQEARKIDIKKIRSNDWELYMKEFISSKLEYSEIDSINKVINNEKVTLNDMPFLEKNLLLVNNELTDDLFKKLRGVYFEIGKGGELRIIAKVNNIVMSKYNSYGEDLFKSGFPVIFKSPKSNNDTPYLIVQDFNEILKYINDFYINGNNLNIIPNIIWGAVDVNYYYINGLFDNKNIHLIGDDKWKKETKEKLILAEKSSKFFEGNVIDYDVENTSLLSKHFKKNVNNSVSEIYDLHDYQEIKEPILKVELYKKNYNKKVENKVEEKIIKNNEVKIIEAKENEFDKSLNDNDKVKKEEENNQVSTVIDNSLNKLKSSKSFKMFH